MLARASRTDVPVGAGGAAGAEGAGVAEALPRTEPRVFVGGLPGGVVDSSITSHMLDYMLIPDKLPRGRNARKTYFAVVR